MDHVMDFTRQSGIVDPKKLEAVHATIVGAGAIGSIVAFALSKMGVGHLTVLDEDGVTEHNLPNQFYRKSDARARRFKVDALGWLVRAVSDSSYEGRKRMVDLEHPLVGPVDLVIAATDSITSRKFVWEEFKRLGGRHYIDARMGGEYGVLYSVPGPSSPEAAKYERTLFPQKKAVRLSCTEKAIIYNVLPLAGFVGAAVKAMACKEQFPFETVLDLKSMSLSTSKFSPTFSKEKRGEGDEEG